MLILNKLLPMFVLPMGVSLLLLIVALLRKRLWPVSAAAVLLYFCSIPPVGDRLEYWLESRYSAVALDQAETADAIVSLSGVLGPPVPDGYLLNIGEAGERLEAGIRLWQQKKAEWLIFTGGRMPWDKEAELEGVVLARVAAARGIPTEKIVITEEVSNTAEEAVAVARLMHERGWSKIILVTSAGHMPRASRQFRHAGVKIVPFSVDFRVTPRQSLTILDFLPSGGAMQCTETAMREWYGIVFYTLARFTHRSSN